jgi:anti-sigma factor RsiW
MTPNAKDVSCRELVELASSYLEGTLEPERLDALDAHLRACDGCGAYVDQLRQTVLALRSLGDGEAIEPETRAAVLAAFAEHHS